MADEAYVILWEYEVRPEAVAEFERVYGPEGDWMAMFRDAPGWRSTTLLRDQEVAGRYMTIDVWESAETYRAFRSARAEDLQALDEACERMTATETIVGHFEKVE